jgi:large subunit ribosomal protein L3
VNKPVTGQFAAAGVNPRRHLTELRLDDEAAAEYEVGQELTAEIFADGSYVDVTGTSKGKGFAGMKRHGFKGQGASHGAQRCTAAGLDRRLRHPGRVFKGTRMSGRMGSDRVTTQNLLVHKVDAENGVLLIKGAIPGRNGGLVMVRTAVKRVRSNDCKKIDVHTPAARRRLGRAARRAVRRRAQHRADAPGRRRAAGRQASGHARDQDPRRGLRWRQEAVPAEGHRPRPSGLDPRPQFTGGGIVHGPQPRDYSQRTPKKMIAAALRGALTGPATTGSTRSPSW